MATKAWTTGRNAPVCLGEDFGLWSGYRGNQISFLEEFGLDAGDVAQLVEGLPSMHEDLGFRLSTSKPNSSNSSDSYP